MPEVHGSRVDDSVTIGPFDAVRGIDTDPVSLAAVAQRSRELGVEIVSVADRTVKQHHGSGVACFTGTPIQALVAADGLGLPSAGAHHDGQHGDDGGRPRLRSRHHCEGAGGKCHAVGPPGTAASGGGCPGSTARRGSPRRAPPRRCWALLHGATRQGWSKGSDDAVMS